MRRGAIVAALLFAALLFAALWPPGAKRLSARGFNPSFLTLCLFILFAALRLFALGADPPPSLDWTSGIWTDEGFYTYAARNTVLFGGTRDDFHPEVLSPVLNAVQEAIFRTFGVGLIQARLISVACSLGALALFWDGLRRVWGPKVALTGLLFLGGDAIFVFYNRLALLETPAVLVVCAAFWAYTLNRHWAWVLAGALAASALAFKTTFLLFLPLPPLVWLLRRAWQPLGWYALGVAVGVAAYWLGWGQAHGAEVMRLNHYYWTHQSQPRSLTEVGTDLWRAVFGPHRSVLGFLLTRSPVVTLLALAGLVMGCRRRPPPPPIMREPEVKSRGGVPPPVEDTAKKGAARQKGAASSAPTRVPPLLGARGSFLLARDTEQLFCWWAIFGLGFLCLTRYAPTRYDLVVLPALAALAALSLRRLPLVWGKRLPTIRAVRAAALALFLCVSLGQWGYWAATRGYQTRDVSRALAQIVPPGVTLAGDWAPGLCLNNRVRAVPVLPDLANGQDPLRDLRPGFVLVAQTPYPVRYWKRAAPLVVRPENVAARFRVHDYRLILYRVPPVKVNK